MPVFRPLRFILLLVPVLFASHCQTQPASVLSGKIAIQPGWRPVLYLVQPRSFGDIAASYAGAVVDSAVIRQDGSFAFERFQMPVEPALYEIVMQPEGSRFANKLVDDDPETANYFPVILKKGLDVRLQAEASRLQASAVIKPYSGDNQAIVQLRDIRRTTFDRTRRAPEGDVHNDASVLMEQATRLEQYRAPLMAFADTTASYWAALVAIRWVGPDGDYERVPEFLHRQCVRWQDTQADHPLTQQLCHSVRRANCH